MVECKYCRGSVNNREFLLGEGIEYEDSSLTYIDGDNKLSSVAHDEEFKINHCPMCGREL